MGSETGLVRITAREDPLVESIEAVPREKENDSKASMEHIDTPWGLGRAS